MHLILALARPVACPGWQRIVIITLRVRIPRVFMLVQFARTASSCATRWCARGGLSVSRSAAAAPVRCERTGPGALIPIFTTGRAILYP